MNTACSLLPKSPELSYMNSKGKQITVGITHHARKRFMERWRRIYPSRELDASTVDATIAKCFSQSERCMTTNRKIRTRLKRHGKDTLYFKTSHFTFVVQDAALLTVEICIQSKRYLNKHEPARISIATRNPGISVQAEKPQLPSERAALTEKAVKIQVPSFRLTAIVLLENGSKTNVNLGTHESLTSHADPNKLIAKPGFVQLVRDRLREKCPGGELDGLFIALGKKQATTLFCPGEHLR